jgi:DNA-binding NarL/FixJ family response regulator
LEFADENAYRRAQFIGRLNLAQTYLESKDIQNARRLFKEAQSFAEGDVQDTLPMQQGLEASICAAEGDHKRAYEIQCEAQAHRTELLSAQIQQAVATRMAHYNFHQALKARAEREQSDRELEAMRRHQLEQQLTSTAMSLAAQTDLLATFREDLTEIIRSIAEPSTALRHVRDKLKALPCEQLDWMQFEVQFTEVHPEFRAKLVEKYPMLTKQEIKMCQLARLGLKTTEMARLLCLSERSIESHRYSLRKKLGLSSEQNLTEFLQSTT